MAQIIEKSCISVSRMTDMQDYINQLVVTNMLQIFSVVTEGQIPVLPNCPVHISVNIKV